MKKILLPVLLGITLSGSAFAQKKTAADSIAIELVYVKGGSFDMGDDSGAKDRRPIHNVTIHDFNIGKYEITEAQYVAVMGKNPTKYGDCPSCPVTNVTWDDALEFVNKLNEKTGKHYRLPTEAEWEYAARGGVKENKEHFRKHAGRKLLQTIAWYVRNSNDHVHPTGLKKANELGVHDMTGNVEEWCADWYSKDYYSKKDVTDPKGPDGGKSKVVRGGSWNSENDELSITRRAAYLPDTKTVYLGFRIAE